MDPHDTGDCWPDNCRICQQTTCEVCDGQGVVYSTVTHEDETCRTCMGTGYDR